MSSRWIAITTTSTWKNAPQTSIDVVYSPTSTRTPGLRTVSRTPSSASCSAPPPPSAPPSGRGSSAGPPIRVAASVVAANSTTTAESAAAVPDVASRTPAITGPARPPRPSSSDTATFDAVSCSGERATAGSSADCTGR